MVKKEMTVQDVIDFLQLMAENNIEVWIDGGWAVDALLEKQTRAHEDMDIAVRHRDAERISALLEARGFVEVIQDDSWLCNFVMGDEEGHRIDVHSFEFDQEGNHIFGVDYPFDSLKGSGKIGEMPVQCIAPAWLVKFHTGYPLDKNDFKDVKALCKKFELPLPEEYNIFIKE